MPSIGEKLKLARKRKGLTQSELAKLCGWSHFPSRISNYERGLREPKSEHMLTLAQVLNVSVEWLYSDVDATSLSTHEQPAQTYQHVHWVPVIEWEDIFKPKEERARPTEHLVCTQSISKESFALVIKGDSMQAHEGETFLPGSYIIVDPQRKPRNNQFVLAQLKPGTEATFKQLIIDAGVQYLKPLNPRYPLLQMNDDSNIIGPICEMVRHFS